MYEINEIQGEINAFKQLLTNSDYQAIKHSEGEMTDKEYAPILANRKKWRQRINELEEQLRKEVNRDGQTQ